MEYSYLKVPKIPHDVWFKMQHAIADDDDILPYLKSTIPDFKAYKTLFTHDGKIYHSDTLSDDRVKKIQECYQIAESVIDELPKEIVIEKKLTGVSENFFFKTMMIALHGDAAQNLALIKD